MFQSSLHRKYLSIIHDGLSQVCSKSVKLLENSRAKIVKYEQENQELKSKLHEHESVKIEAKRRDEYL